MQGGTERASCQGVEDSQPSDKGYSGSSQCWNGADQKSGSRAKYGTDDNDTKTMRKRPNKAGLAVQVARVRKKTLRGQMEDLNVVIQDNFGAILYAAKVVWAHWRKKSSAVEVTHAAKRRAASATLEESS